ncbi:hypothetical protein [Paenochrobactrum glaciei]|uniref:Restriction endonuclease n=1 Tax=Paenochrobactrum glaciei TaxID=486407 RepID=A0ABP3RCV1_9HYPH
MNEELFLKILNEVREILDADVKASAANHKPAAFENFARITFANVLHSYDLENAMEKIDQGFPDIVIGKFGAEIKATESNNWRCVANSVSEGRRALDVEKIYVIYGKMGGIPEVRTADYGASICHVRTSHVPRFEINLDPNNERHLFDTIGITYDQFRHLDMHEKMEHVRTYARARLKPGERLWWLEDNEVDDQQQSMSLAVKVYMDLEDKDKIKLRAEAALMCPQIVAHSRKYKRKYTDPVVYMMAYRGVLCPQARDLFSAGSVAGKVRGGKYVQHALKSIEEAMRTAAFELEEALFKEYWETNDIPRPEKRILRWLEMADDYAEKYYDGWKPSDYLFLEEQAKNASLK